AHEVPLTAELLELLERVPKMSQYIFTGGTGGQLSDVMAGKAAKKHREGITLHGFRSTFKDWARLHTAYPDEVSELQLAHVSDDKTRAAYARDGLISKRRALMSEWARFCEEGHTSKSAKVHAIGGG